MEGKVIKTDKLNNFCGGCNNSVILGQFFKADENESMQSAWDRADEPGRTMFIGMCVCGNVYLKE